MGEERKRGEGMFWSGCKTNKHKSEMLSIICILFCDKRGTAAWRESEHNNLMLKFLSVCLFFFVSPLVSFPFPTSCDDVGSERNGEFKRPPSPADMARECIYEHS